MPEMKKKIAIAKGDGIGPDVVNEGLKIMDTIAKFSDYQFEYIETPMGGNVWKEFGTSLPDQSFELMKQSDAILFGAVGLPDLPQGVAEYAILKVRQGLDQYVNLRPAKLYEPLRDKCPLKEEYIQNGIDLTVVRENTEGIYTKIGGIAHNDAASNTMLYTRRGVERLIKYGFDYAKRKGHTEVISVDKANILACSEFWRQIFTAIGKSYPEIKKTNFYVDAFCQWLIRKPYTVQTVVTENMFGDIISDESAYLIGSLGMAPSGNINPEGVSMYEPIHGSAPDIAGQGVANPIGTILAVKIMLEESFHDSHHGQLIENAVVEALTEGRTKDIMPEEKTKAAKLKPLTTIEMGDSIAFKLQKLLKS
jgi:3-isopropylmalate dehydrogenase